MTPAVADPAKLGYTKLYKMMLDMVRLISIIDLLCKTHCRRGAHQWQSV